MKKENFIRNLLIDILFTFVIGCIFILLGWIQIGTFQLLVITVLLVTVFTVFMKL